MKNIIEEAYSPRKVSKYIPKHTLTTSEREEYEANKLALANLKKECQRLLTLQDNSTTAIDKIIDKC